MDGKRAIQVTINHLTTFVATIEKGIPFTDVNGHWAYDAIAYMSDKGLMNGTSDTRFTPDGTVSRAMLVAVLHRLENSPAVNSKNPFNDVAMGQWYTDAVIWASQNKLISGYGDGSFGPTDNVTREQMAVILYNYAQYKEYDVGGNADLTAFTDAATVSNWALDAIKWANAEGLIIGRTVTTIAPAGTATRGEMANILMRFIENIIK